MVKSLTEQDKQAISAAITEAEKATNAEIVFVVSEISDAYQSYVLLVALTAGSLLAAISFWLNLLTEFPYLLMIQISFIALFSFIPMPQNFCMRFVPQKILRKRAAHRAYEEYIAISRNIQTAIPILVLYVSIAEHYVHILADRQVRGKIPDETLDSVIKEFTETTSKKELRDACIETIEHVTKLLAQYFPNENSTNYISDEVVTN